MIHLQLDLQCFSVSAFRQHGLEIECLSFASLSLKEVHSLEVPFREEEFFIALNEMDGDKASGLDGFTLAFWQDSWYFVKEEIMEMFHEFFAKGAFTRSISTTFLVLSPKREVLRI